MMLISTLWLAGRWGWWDGHHLPLAKMLAVFCPITERSSNWCHCVLFGWASQRPADPKRRTSSSCRMYHHYNFRWVSGKNELCWLRACLHHQQNRFSCFFPAIWYHQALQFRGYLTANAIAWSQKDFLWPLDYQNTRLKKDYGQAMLVYQVMEECDAMWSSKSTKEKLENMQQLQLDSILPTSLLQAYHLWWHGSSTTLAERQKVKSIAIDGHEKVAAKCTTLPPSRPGRPRKVLWMVHVRGHGHRLHPIHWRNEKTRRQCSCLENSLQHRSFIASGQLLHLWSGMQVLQCSQSLQRFEEDQDLGCGPLPRARAFQKVPVFAAFGEEEHWQAAQRYQY